VRARLTDERELLPNERLDALGWSIYLSMLAQAAGLDLAATWALKATLAERNARRRILLGLPPND
jgi:hypothetical protein